MEDNNYYSNSAGVKRIGMAITDSNIDIYPFDEVNDTEGEHNEVYRNTFNNLAYATIAQGKNSNSPDNLNLGLVEKNKQKKPRVYPDIEDGGDTQRVLQLINDNSLSSRKLRDKIDPFLPFSDTVLKALIARRQIHQWHLTDLLIANAPLSRSVFKVYNKKEPLDDFFHDLFMVYQTQESTYTPLDMFQYEAMIRKQLAKSKYFKMILLDTRGNYAKNESLEDMMEIEVALADYQLKFSKAFQNRSYVDAQRLLDEYPLAASSDGFKIVAQMMLDRRIDKVEHQALSQAQIATLIPISKSRLPGKYMAQSLLENASDIASVEVIVLPEIGTSNRSEQVEEKENSAVELFEIYPNPASDYAYFAFDLPKETDKAFITIFDAGGKQIEVLDLSDNMRVHRLSLENYISGLYTITFEIDGKLITTKSFSVIK